MLPRGHHARLWPLSDKASSNPCGWSSLRPQLALFIQLIIRTFQLVFSAGTMFFSHNNSANSIFQPAYQHSRTEPYLRGCWCRAVITRHQHIVYHLQPQMRAHTGVVEHHGAPRAPSLVTVDPILDRIDCSSTIGCSDFEKKIDSRIRIGSKRGGYAQTRLK
jgi:hypothetical protein